MISTETNPANQSETKTLTFLEVLLSTLSAAIGVQSRDRMERDLTHGEIGKFLAAGLIFTVLFVVGMVVLVNLVISG